ncbi:MAG: prolyl oligopeptidase family serine peptidase, partial [Acidobacteriota bacterium]
RPKASRAQSRKGKSFQPSTWWLVMVRPASTSTGPPKPIPRAEVDTPPAACAERDKQIAESYVPYIDAFSNRGLELSPDGKTLLLLSDRGGGSYQLYLAAVDKPAADPVPIAQAKDGVSDARFSADGLYILFTRDRDKNENTQIFRATVDGKEVVALTKESDRFHSLPRVSPDWRTAVYFRGRHKTGGVALVTQPIEGGAAKKVIEAKGFHFLSDLSPDGKEALCTALLSMSRSQLFAVDLKSGKRRTIAPKQAAAHAHSGVFSGDGKSVYLITDEESERAVLRKVDAASGATQATFADPAAEVADVVVPRKGAVLAVLLDHGSHHTVKLLDVESLKEKARVKLPLGWATLGQFTADGSGVVVTLSTPASPGDVHLLGQNGRLKPLRREKRPGLKKLAGITATVEKVPGHDGTPVPLNLYLPKKPPRGKKLPTVVEIHGGPASSSVVRWNPLVGLLVARGFAVVQPNVRGSTGFGKAYEKADNGPKRMDAVKDLLAVNEWVRKQGWADPERLVAMGGSYGGYMTYMALGHQPEKWRAGVAMVGVVNLVTFLRTTTGAIRLAFREEFGELPKDKAFLKEVSPLTVVGKIKAPLFVYQGANDPRVPRSEQDQMVTALRAAKIPVEYMVADDEGHSLNQRPNKLAFVGRSLRFLEQHLGLPGLPAGCQGSETKAATAEKKPAEKKPAEKKPAEKKPASK